MGIFNSISWIIIPLEPVNCWYKVKIHLHPHRFVCSPCSCSFPICVKLSIGCQRLWPLYYAPNDFQQIHIVILSLSSPIFSHSALFLPIYVDSRLERNLSHIACCVGRCWAVVHCSIIACSVDETDWRLCSLFKYIDLRVCCSLLFDKMRTSFVIKPLGTAWCFLFFLWVLLRVLDRDSGYSLPICVEFESYHSSQLFLYKDPKT